jgi:hypothetical protein
MARICSVPAEVGIKPEFGDFGHDFTKYTAATEKWIAAIIAYVKKNGSGELKGEIVRFPVADGHAQYVVFSSKPLQLIHLPVYDAWHFQYANRLTVKDIKEEVRRGKALKAMFASRG